MSKGNEFFLPGFQRYHLLNIKIKRWFNGTVWIGNFFEELTKRILITKIPTWSIFCGLGFTPDWEGNGVLIEVKAARVRVSKGTRIRIDPGQLEVYTNHFAPTAYCLWFYTLEGSCENRSVYAIYKSIKSAELYIVSSEDLDRMIEDSRPAIYTYKQQVLLPLKTCMANREHLFSKRIRLKLHGTWFSLVTNAYDLSNGFGRSLLRR